MDGSNMTEPKGFFTLRRIISSTVLLFLVLALVLMFKKPATIARPLAPEASAEKAQSFQNKVDEMAKAQAEGQPSPEIHLTADEISAAIAQANPQILAAAAEGQAESGDLPSIQGQPSVSFEGDLMKGQFLAELAGRKVYVTVEGHLGAKDGYATFEPTAFKVGDLSVPVSLVNDALQKKMIEQRDQLKLPDSVSGIKVENGELVVNPK